MYEYMNQWYDMTVTTIILASSIYARRQTRTTTAVGKL